MSILRTSLLPASYPFHPQKPAWQVTAPAPFEDGLLSLKRTVGRRYPHDGSVNHFSLPPSIVDHLDALQYVAVRGWGRG